MLFCACFKRESSDKGVSIDRAISMSLLDDVNRNSNEENAEDLYQIEEENKTTSQLETQMTNSRQRNNSPQQQPNSDAMTTKDLDGGHETYAVNACGGVYIISIQMVL